MQILHQGADELALTCSVGGLHCLARYVQDPQNRSEASTKAQLISLRVSDLTFAKILALVPPSEPLQPTIAFNGMKSLVTLIGGSVVDKPFEKESKPMIRPSMLCLWGWVIQEPRWGTMPMFPWIVTP